MMRILRWSLFLCILTIVALSIVFLVNIPDESVSACGNYDAIVILGGGEEDRCDEAYRLWRLAPKTPVIITGDWQFYDGENGYLFDMVTSRGIPEHCIIVERMAQNTWENGMFTVPLLNSIEARSVVIVTDWYHAKRTKAVFNNFSDSIQFIVSSKKRKMNHVSEEGYSVNREKLAIIYYVFRYRIRI